MMRAIIEIYPSTTTATELQIVSFQKENFLCIGYVEDGHWTTYFCNLLISNVLKVISIYISPSGKVFNDVINMVQQLCETTFPSTKAVPFISEQLVHL